MVPTDPTPFRPTSRTRKMHPSKRTERNYPVRINQYSLLADSEGAGRFRGGLGLRREYVFVDHEPLFTILADRTRFPPWGLFRGQAGQRARYVLLSERLGN